MKLHKLALNYCSKDVLSRIRSGIRRPLYVYDCPSNENLISYAQILAKMNVTRPLPNSIKICDPMGQMIDPEIL